MREGMGLYKAKRIDNGEWVEGSLLIDGEKWANKSEDSFSNCYIVPERDLDNIITALNDGSYLLKIQAFFVDPQTIGQWTGLVDKNGVQIFEGDIIRTHRIGLWWVVGFELNAFCAMDGDKVQFAFHEQYVFDYKTGKAIPPDYFEVIGSIHDKAVEE